MIYWCHFRLFIDVSEAQSRTGVCARSLISLSPGGGRLKMSEDAHACAFLPPELGFQFGVASSCTAVTVGRLFLAYYF